MESIIYGTTGNQLDNDSDAFDDKPNEDWITELETVSRACGPSRKTVDLLAVANTLITHTLSEDLANIPQLLCTFSTLWAAFNLNQRPDIAQISVDSLAEKYCLSDLHPALLDFLSDHVQNPSVHHIGGRRRARADTRLPFNDVMVWYSLCLQTQSPDNDSVTEP